MDALQYMPRARDIPDRRLLLFLPLSHVFARFMATVAFAGTLTLGLTSNMKTIIKDFEDFGPTLLLAVPRVFEKVYNAASQRAGTGFAGRMFARGVRVAREWSKAKQSGNGIPAGLRMRHAFYDAVVYKKIRTVFGRNADFAITGGAPMDSDLAHFYNGIGMPLLEGYGMTETSGPVCVSLPENNHIDVYKRQEVELVLHQVECELRTVKGSSAEFLYEWLPVALFPYRIGGLAHARRERWQVGSGDGGRHGFRHMMSPYVGVSQQVQRVTLSRSQLV